MATPPPNYDVETQLTDLQMQRKLRRNTRRDDRTCLSRPSNVSTNERSNPPIRKATGAAKRLVQLEPVNLLVKCITNDEHVTNPEINPPNMRLSMFITSMMNSKRLNVQEYVNQCFRNVADQLILDRVIQKSVKILKRLKKLEKLEYAAISESTLTQTQRNRFGIASSFQNSGKSSLLSNIFAAKKIPRAQRASTISLILTLKK